MNRTSLPLTSIIVENRQRQDYGDIADLAESLKRFGIIQPIIVNQDNKLIAGGRRLAAATQLGWEKIDVVYRETLSQDELHELEMEENIRRKDFDWREKVLNIATIHSIKKNRSVLEGRTWGMRETAEALGMSSQVSVQYAIRLAKELWQGKENKIWQCESMFEAWKLLMRDQEDAINKELAERQSLATFNFDSEAELSTAKVYEETITEETPENVRLFASQPYITLTIEQAKALYDSNPLNQPDKFQEYYDGKIAWLRQKENSIYLSSMLYHQDSIGFMKENNNCFDHIITDIPYGIDMDMLNQQSPDNGMKDIDTVIEEHDVDYNKQLITDFFPAAFSALKEHGFCITWCDQMLWQYMYDLAVAAGFKVQRWPITWVKTHSCMNQSAHFNFTKSTEIAMVCRKGKATLMRPQSQCTITAGRDELCDAIGHPFAKPRVIWEYLINAVSIEGQLILEPFAGRGSGVLSILGAKRHCMGVELQEAHYNALLENVKVQHFLKLNPNSIFK